MDIREAIRTNNRARIDELLERRELGNYTYLDVIRLLLEAREPRNPNRVLAYDVAPVAPIAPVVPELPPITIKLTDEQLANQCAICLEKYTEETPITLINQCHGFHTICINELINKGIRNCPKCREPIISRQSILNDPNSVITHQLYLEKYKKYKSKYLQLKGIR